MDKLCAFVCIPERFIYKNIETISVMLMHSICTERRWVKFIYFNLKVINLLLLLITFYFGPSTRVLTHTLGFIHQEAMVEFS
jgi:hypothetical protein